MNEIMQNEIQQQADALERCLPQLRDQFAKLDLTRLRAERVVVFGSGDSFFAPLAMAFMARTKLGPRIGYHVVPTYEAQTYWPFVDSDLAVAISTSGEAKHGIRALRRAKEAGATVISLTANADSTIARQADGSIVIPERAESRKTPHSLDYSTTLLAIALFVEWVSGTAHTEINETSEIVAGVIQGTTAAIGRVAASVADSRQFFFLGSGPSHATAQYAAAKMWEAGGILSHHSELEEFAHGAHLMVESGDPVVIIAPGCAAGLAAEIIAGLQHIGAQSIVFSDEKTGLKGTYHVELPKAPEALTPFTGGVASQLLCLYVANEMGYDVVTKTGRRPNMEPYEKAHFEWVR